MGTGWGQIGWQLSDALIDLPTGAVLLIVDAVHPDHGSYVQFRTDETALRCEVCLAASAPPERRLEPRHEARLRAIGWAEPKGDERNWWREVDMPADSGELSELAIDVVDVLSHMLRFPDPQAVRYHGWVEATGEPILLPRLEIPHRDTAVAVADLPGSARYFARLAPGDTVERPLSLLRRDQADGDAALTADGDWQPTESLRRSDAGELRDPVVPVSREQAAAVASRWRALSARQAATMAAQARGELGMRVARSVDQERDEQGRPVVYDPPLDPGEVPAVVDYLGTAPLLASTTATAVDPFDSSVGEAVPLNLHTDGMWIWSESLAYFAHRYGIAPEPDFLAHIRERRYRFPDLPPETLARASEVVRSGIAQPPLQATSGGPVRMDPETGRRLDQS